MRFKFPQTKYERDGLVKSNYELMTREPRKIARKRFMMFSCSIISREEHIKSRHEPKNQKVTLKRCYIQQLKSFIAKHILPIVNPEMFTIERFFWIEMHSHRLLEYFELCWHKKSWPTFLIS